MNQATKKTQDISFFSEDVEDTKSKTRYISRVLMLLHHSQFRHNIQGLIILLATCFFFFLGATMSYISIFKDSPETVIARNVYSKQVQESVSQEQVKAFFNEVKKHIAFETEEYLKLYNQMSEEDLKNLSFNANPNLVYTTLMENNKSLENKMIEFLNQLQSPAIIDSYNDGEIQYYTKILWLIKTDNYYSPQIIGTNMNYIVSNNKIMKNIINAKEFKKSRGNENVNNEVKSELPEVIKNNIKLNQNSAIKTNI